MILESERPVCRVQGQQQQAGVSHAAVAEQLQAAISELLGFTVPLDQVLNLTQLLSCMHDLLAVHQAPKAKICTSLYFWMLQPLMEAGLDSIGAVELRNAVSTKFGIELPATATFDYPSADALARYVVGQTATAGQSFGRQQPRQAIEQPMVDQRHIAAQLAATVSELLGFEVPADQVRAQFLFTQSCMQMVWPPL